MSKTVSNGVELLLKICFVWVLYLVLGKLALWLAIPPGYAMAVYPPAGIALGAVLIGGRMMALGVGLGSLSLNLWISSSTQAIDSTALTLASLIACGAMLQALCAAALIKRFVGYPSPLDNNRSILQFMLLGSVIACMINASIGVGSLYFMGVLKAHALFNNWLTWWIGDSLGVLTITPACLILFGQPRSIWRARRVSVLSPTLITLFIVVVVFAFVRQWEQGRSEAEFKDRAQRLTNAMQARLDYHIEVQKNVVSLFSAFENISERQFAGFVAQPISNYSALQAITWAPRITDAQRPAFETRLSQSELMRQMLDLGNGQIMQMGADGRTQKAARRAEYFPFAYVAPMLGNSSLPGFDLNSNPLINKAIEEARDIGLVVATGPIPDLPISRDKALAALVSPLYLNKPGGIDVEQRRANLSGLVVSVLNMGEALEGVLGAGDKANLHLRLLDLAGKSANGAGQPYAYYDSWGTAKNNAGLRFRLDFAGRELLLQVRASDAYWQQQKAWAAWTALAGGMLFAGLVGMYLLLVSGRSYAIEALVEQRTVQLHESEQRLQAILENAADGIMTMDARGNILLVNHALCKLLDYEAQDLMHTHIGKLFVENAGELLREFESRETQNFCRELTGISYNQQQIPLELSIAKIGTDGEQMYILIAHDLTERKRIEQLKSDFVSAVSHELRTPLTSIRGSLGLLTAGVSGNFGPQAEKLLQLANSNAERLSVLINDLLDFEKLECGGMRFHMEVLDLLAVVKKTMELNLGYAQKFSISLQLEQTGAAQAVQPLQVNADELRLIQVLGNLLSNAIKFSRPQGMVGIRLELEGRHAMVSICDQGTGIPDEFKPRIFAKFSQADGSSQKKFGGTGLGLSLAKMMIEKMGGQIGFESSEGVGSRFFIRLPLYVQNQEKT